MRIVDKNEKSHIEVTNSGTHILVLYRMYKFELVRGESPEDTDRDADLRIPLPRREKEWTLEDCKDGSPWSRERLDTEHTHVIFAPSDPDISTLPWICTMCRTEFQTQEEADLHLQGSDLIERALSQDQ